MMFFCHNGYLPWMDGENITKEMVLDIKQNTSIESLTEGFPPCFRTYLKYCRKLKFE